MIMVGFILSYLVMGYFVIRFVYVPIANSKLVNTPRVTKEDNFLLVLGNFMWPLFLFMVLFGFFLLLIEKGNFYGL